MEANLANGKNAEKNGHIYEFWSRRPFRYWNKTSVNKKLTVRQERRVEKKSIIAEEIMALECTEHDTDR